MIFSNMIPHGNYAGLPPEGQLLAVILGLLAFLVGYGEDQWHQKLLTK